MTKSVRIENADNSSYKVVVEVWDIQHDGTEVFICEYPLNYPTTMTTQSIHSTRFLKIKERQS